jgi:U4/U6.U5 tri-snRNP-associated protein 2
VTTEKGTGKGKAAGASEDVVEHVPFLLLGLDLPPVPLFKDALEKNIIPQVGRRYTVLDTFLLRE